MLIPIAAPTLQTASHEDPPTDPWRLAPINGLSELVAFGANRRAHEPCGKGAAPQCAHSTTRALDVDDALR